jgi:LPPG:FO 2-phospho-L-lactate transferase
MHVIALAGGVGGAKLAHGLSLCLSPDELTIVVNTGDDFIHYGLYICPDLDTVCYTLAGLADPERGWGRINETWNALESISNLKGIDWFRIGDKDLGIHLERTRLLLDGKRLTEITHQLCNFWEIKHLVSPMCDEKVSTSVKTKEFGWIPFQEYFVKYHFEPTVEGFRFEGIEKACLSPKLSERFEKADLVIVCPSNPWVSIDPILAVPGVKDLICNKKVVGVSPIIDGRTIKGPAAKMFRELGIQPSVLSIAAHYQKILKALVIDFKDKSYSQEIRASGIIPLTAHTLMLNDNDREQLARTIISLSLQV